MIENQKPLFFEIIKLLLILLWACTAASKLVDVKEFRNELNNQTFSQGFADLLFWFIPISEITAALCLVFARSRWMGLILSSILMFLFTGYVALVILNYYDQVPCICGGVFQHMSWTMHFWFNLFFLMLSLWATHYYYQRFKRKQK